MVRNLVFMDRTREGRGKVRGTSTTLSAAIRRIRPYDLKVTR